MLYTDFTAKLLEMEYLIIKNIETTAISHTIYVKMRHKKQIYPICGKHT